MKAHELLRVQHYEPIDSNGGVRLTGVKPYLRLCRGNAAPIFVKGGSLYGEGGQPVDVVPEWFWEEARKLSPAARAEVSLRLPDDTGKPEPEVTQRVEVLATWTCPECSDTMPTRKKGIHVAAHKRKARQPEVAGHI